MADSVIRLYPGNWLYNAGVIGFLEVMACGECSKEVENWFKDDGSVELDKKVFDFIKIGNKDLPLCLYRYVELLTQNDNIQEWIKKTDKNKVTYEQKFKDIAKEFGGEWGYRYIRAMNRLFASDMPYQNLFQKSDWVSNSLINFINKIPEILNIKTGIRCGLCNNFDYSEVPYLSEETIKRIKIFSEMYVHNLNIGPSIKQFPNGFWNNSQSFYMCPMCSYLIIHHHLALTTLSDKSTIFVNAPSFKLMWYLNRYVKEVYGREKIKVVKELLGMSIIELALKLHIQLGKWTMMNIEAIIQYREGDSEKIDFFSLPYETILILSDSNIASLINDIGEINILDLVLDGRYKEILDYGERIFKIGLKNKNDWGKHEWDFINNKIKIEKNRNNLIYLSQKLFKLYALIEEKIGKGVHV
uniref:Type I-B CRISPR-associated protein Cas8b1/Cst1 n=1 Tax=Thermodesulfobacterium geofontis TaxID=1295609 RepID=A0A7V5XGT2_9BACT